MPPCPAVKIPGAPPGVLSSDDPKLQTREDRMKRLYGAAGALAVALLTATPAAAGGKGKTYKSPQEVFAAFKEAAKNDDWKALSQCLTEDSLKMMAGGMAVGGLMAKGFLEIGRAHV